jgi:hypothetical protein
MKIRCLQYAIIRAASFLAPHDQRSKWIQEWRSELWYIPRRGATLFCLGAFRDALWVRRNNLSPVKRTGSHLESPASCLAFLATLAAVSVVVAVGLLGPLRLRTTHWHLTAHDLPAGCVVMLPFTILLLLVTRLVTGQAPADGFSAPWPSRLCRWMFLALKIALVQPIILCGFFALILSASIVPMAPLGFFTLWFLTCRWLILDQWRRCPMCLRLLTNPVRIGTPSQTFLDWYGAESVCSRGHGLLLVPEIPTSYPGRRRWLRLDASWSGLFSQVSGARH